MASAAAPPAPPAGPGKPRMGKDYFAPVGEPYVERAPLRSPAATAPGCTIYDLYKVYDHLCSVDTARSTAAGEKPAKHYSCGYYKNKTRLGAEIDRLMLANGVTEVALSRVHRPESVPILAVGTLLCRDDDKFGYEFARVCKVDKDGTLHLELYKTETLERRDVGGMNTWHRCRVIDAEPIPNSSAKRRRIDHRDPSADLGLAAREMMQRREERARPEFYEGTWSFITGRHCTRSWALWEGFASLAPGNEYEETVWDGY